MSWIPVLKWKKSPNGYRLETREQSKEPATFIDEVLGPGQWIVSKGSEEPYRLRGLHPSAFIEFANIAAAVDSQRAAEHLRFASKYGLCFGGNEERIDALMDHAQEMLKALPMLQDGRRKELVRKIPVRRLAMEAQDLLKSKRTKEKPLTLQAPSLLQFMRAQLLYAARDQGVSIELCKYCEKRFRPLRSWCYCSTHCSDAAGRKGLRPKLATHGPRPQAAKVSEHLSY